MKLSRVLKTALAVLALAPALAWAAAGTGLSGTPHDFTPTNADPMGVNVTEVGVCTYCHTPHKALSTLLLWNHTLSTNTFSWDVAKTTAGTDFPSIAGGTYKGPTAKCLSCHDGSVAIGDIAWFKEAPHNGAAANNLFKIGDDSTAPLITKVQGGGDMSGNHPVAMPYALGNAPSTYNSITTGNGLVLAEWVANPAAPVRLFNDDGTGAISAGAVAGKTGIECSSCHDPHNKAATEDYFLRGKLTGSTAASGYLCLQCHIK